MMNLTEKEVKAIAKATAVEVTDAIMSLKTVLFEPMNDKVYGTFSTLTEAMRTYNITKDDWYTVIDNTVYVGLTD